MLHFLLHRIQVRLFCLFLKKNLFIFVYFARVSISLQPRRDRKLNAPSFRYTSLHSVRTKYSWKGIATHTKAVSCCKLYWPLKIAVKLKALATDIVQMADCVRVLHALADKANGTRLGALAGSAPSWASIGSNSVTADGRPIHSQTSSSATYAHSSVTSRHLALAVAHARLGSLRRSFYSHTSNGSCDLNDTVNMNNSERSSSQHRRNKMSLSEWKMFLPAANAQSEAAAWAIGSGALCANVLPHCGAFDGRTVDILVAFHPLSSDSSASDSGNNNRAVSLSSRDVSSLSAADVLQQANASPDEYVLRLLGQNEILSDSSQVLAGYECVQRSLSAQREQLTFVAMSWDDAYSILPSADSEPLSVAQLADALAPENEALQEAVGAAQKPGALAAGIAGMQVRKDFSSFWDADFIYVVVELRLGDECLAYASTDARSPSSLPAHASEDQAVGLAWAETQELTWRPKHVSLASVPSTCHFCVLLFTMTVNRQRPESTPVISLLGWQNLTCATEGQLLRSGVSRVSLWTDSRPSHCALQPCSRSPVTIFLTLSSVKERVRLGDPWDSRFPPSLVGTSDSASPKGSSLFLEALRAGTDNPGGTIRKPSQSEREMVWRQRSLFSSEQIGLSALLNVVPWLEPVSSDLFTIIDERIRQQQDKSPGLLADALSLLACRRPVEALRIRALHALSRSVDSEDFVDFILQLVLVAKQEVSYYSPTGALLLLRSLGDVRWARTLFWVLRTELASAPDDRLQLIFESMLCAAPSLQAELVLSDQLVLGLVACARALKAARPTERDATLKRELRRLNIKGTVVLPLHSGLGVKSVITDKCRFFDSKTLPFLVTFESSDQALCNAGVGEANRVRIIFKAGDDLRQDMLVLQALRLMDRMWRQEGLFLAITDYRIVATGNMEGFIELVPESQTLADIQMEMRKSTTAALFGKRYLMEWISKHNPAEPRYSRALDNFVRSLAASCVATYVLGIGDRHNDNVLIREDGRLFHIDFGRILGNWERFGNFSRDRAPFILTKAFACVMGGRHAPLFAKFTNLCCLAFNVIRRNARVFVNLFRIMVGTGIAELRTHAELVYLERALLLDKPDITDKTASELFTALIHKSLDSRWTDANFFIHSVANQAKKKPTRSQTTEDISPLQMSEKEREAYKQRMIDKYEAQQAQGANSTAGASEGTLRRATAAAPPATSTPPGTMRTSTDSPPAVISSSNDEVRYSPGPSEKIDRNTLRNIARKCSSCGASFVQADRDLETAYLYCIGCMAVDVASEATSADREKEPANEPSGRAKTGSLTGKAGASFLKVGVGAKSFFALRKKADSIGSGSTPSPVSEVDMPTEREQPSAGTEASAPQAMLLANVMASAPPMTMLRPASQPNEPTGTASPKFFKPRGRNVLATQNLSAARRGTSNPASLSARPPSFGVRSEPSAPASDPLRRLVVPARLPAREHQQECSSNRPMRPPTLPFGSPSVPASVRPPSVRPPLRPQPTDRLASPTHVTSATAASRGPNNATATRRGTASPSLHQRPPARRGRAGFGFVAKPPPVAAGRVSAESQ